MRKADEQAKELLRKLVDKTTAEEQLDTVKDFLLEFYTNVRQAGWHEGFAEGVAEGRHRNDS